MLFLDVAKEWLQFIFSIFQRNKKGRSFVSYKLLIEPSYEVEQFRSKIWRELINIGAKKCFEDRIQKILTSYASGISTKQIEILQDDSKYIIRLLKVLFPEDTITGCIIADQMKQLFTQMNINVSEELLFYIRSEKFQIYNMMVGARWDTEISLEEYEKQKYMDLDRYIQKGEGNQTVIKRIFSIVPDLLDSKGKVGDLFSVCEGINHVLPKIISNKSDCIYLTKYVVKVRIDQEIKINLVVKGLLKYFSPNEAYVIISDLDSRYKNIWLYSFFCEFPAEQINSFWVEKMYEFLQDDSDKYIEKSACRDLCFLDKYEQCDKEVWVKASRIILSKQVYSTFIPNLYFSLLFNSSHTNPHNTSMKYISAPELLKQIYLLVIQNNRLADRDGQFLQMLCKGDSDFLKVFVRCYFSKEQSKIDNGFSRLFPVFENEHFVEDIDTIIGEAMSTSFIPDSIVPKLIGFFLTAQRRGENFAEKGKAWGYHFIESYSADKRKMEYFFGSIAELPNNQKKEFVKCYLLHNKKLEDFEELPLVPRSYSFTGSGVPLFSGWIEFLNSILTLLPGIEFLQHKKFVKEEIQRVRNKIENAEISEILEG